VSRIFEMLTKSTEEAANVIRPLVDQQTVRTPRTKGPSHADDASGVSAAAPVRKEAPPATPASLDGVRIVTLCVPAPSPLLPFEGGQFRPSEQYRVLRTKISQHPNKPCVIVISSPASGDGKSVTAINTAGALSLKSDAQVLLVDADLRKSVIHQQLGLPQSPGLADVLTGASTLENALVHTKEFPNLYVLSSGSTPANPVELLDSHQWEAVIARLRGMFRYIIIDSPPVATVADYDLLQAVCDGVILVLRPDHTNRHLCQKAIEFVPRAKFLGVLLNCVPDSALRAHAGADYYYAAGERSEKSEGQPTP
jgi:capsular exopolysaccharide synthesis family protein